MLVFVELLMVFFHIIILIIVISPEKLHKIVQILCNILSQVHYYINDINLDIQNKIELNKLKDLKE